MDKETKETMIAMLEDIPNITAVRKLLGISADAYQQARKDPEFVRRVKVARGAGYDMMEHEAHRRAVEGWVEPVFYRGELVAGEDGKPVGVRRYSDTLLKFLLKHCNPKKFNPGVNVNVGDGEKVKLVFNVGPPLPVKESDD
jgi:hypothetical protein